MGRIAVRYCTYCISGLHAVRVAAGLRQELRTDVEMVRGQYGEFKVLVDGEPVIDAGVLAALGVLPSARKVIAAVRDRLSR
jgi:predicted Rdx family selenoprotein